MELPINGINGYDIDMEKCVVQWNHDDEAEVGRPSVVFLSVSACKCHSKID